MNSKLSINPKRRDNEDYEDYRKRRKEENQAVKDYLNTRRYFIVSTEHQRMSTDEILKIRRSYRENGEHVTRTKAIKIPK